MQLIARARPTVSQLFAVNRSCRLLQWRLLPARALLVALAVASAAELLSAQSKTGMLPTVPVMPTTRVDAGVRVMQHDRTALARATQLELAGPPITVIGGANGDPDYDLTFAFYVALLSDGRLATLSPVGNKYYVFGADGQHQRTFGRMGKGPGEFTRPSGNIRLTGDTLMIADDANLQFSWFHPDKGFIRSRARGVNGRLSMERVVGVLPDNRVVVSAAGLVQNGELDKIVRPSAPVAAIGLDGQTNTLAQLPDLELFKMNVTRRGQSHPETLVRTFSTQAVVAVWDSSVVTGTADSYQVDVRNGQGIVTSRILLNSPRVPVTREMREARAEATMRAYRNRPGEGGVRPDRSEIEKIQRETPVADSLPAYQSFFVSPNKTLWVVDATAPNATTWSATAFRKDGAIVGRLRASGGGTPLAFGDDRVVVRTEDDDGVVTLTVRRIAASAGKAK